MGKQLLDFEKETKTQDFAAVENSMLALQLNFAKYWGECQTKIAGDVLNLQMNLENLKMNGNMPVLKNVITNNVITENAVSENVVTNNVVAYNVFTKNVTTSKALKRPYPVDEEKSVSS